MKKKIINKITILLFLALVLIVNVTISTKKNDSGNLNLMQVSYTTNANAEDLGEICVTPTRYGIGNILTWYSEGPDDCFLCDKTGNCDDSCYMYLEICYNLAWPIYDFF